PVVELAARLARLEDEGPRGPPAAAADVSRRPVARRDLDAVEDPRAPRLARWARRDLVELHLDRLVDAVVDFAEGAGVARRAGEPAGDGPGAHAQRAGQGGAGEPLGEQRGE